jgi:hypothetical protein
MATTRWVRYVVPVRCDNDAIDRVVALTGEDRDDRGQFCIYDENFVRRHADGLTEDDCYAEIGPYDPPRSTGRDGLRDQRTAR